jgi:hypothetical protein
MLRVIISPKLWSGIFDGSLASKMSRFFVDVQKYCLAV